MAGVRASAGVAAGAAGATAMAGAAGVRGARRTRRLRTIAARNSRQFAGPGRFHALQLRPRQPECRYRRRRRGSVPAAIGRDHPRAIPACLSLNEKAAAGIGRGQLVRGLAPPADACAGWAGFPSQVRRSEDHRSKPAFHTSRYPFDGPRPSAARIPCRRRVH